MRWTADFVECAVANHFGFRSNIIVPNVSWGIWGLNYEADMVIVRPSGWAMEVEIKVSAADIVADTRKSHHHNSRRFRQLWFAVPSHLAPHPAIPLQAGILSVTAYPQHVTAMRAAQQNKDAQRWSPADMYRLTALGTMRIWVLKAALAARRNREAADARPA